MALSAESTTDNPKRKEETNGSGQIVKESQERGNFEATARNQRKTLPKKQKGQSTRIARTSKGKLRHITLERRKSRESAKTTRSTTSTRMGKEGKYSTPWNGVRNSFETFAHPKAYTFHNQGHTCYLGSSLHMIRITGLDINRSQNIKK